MYSIDFTFVPDLDYRFVVNVGDSYTVSYREGDDFTAIHFATLKEMEQVAKMMLNAVNAARCADGC